VQAELSRQQPNRITSAEGMARVVAARALLSSRLKPLGFDLVSHVPTAQLNRHLRPPKQVTRSLDAALAKGSISMRGYDSCLRISLTVAALAGRDEISTADIDQAFMLRGSDDLMAAA
jgi:magnesium chelatase family protein